MKFNPKNTKKIERDCNLCRSNFAVWLTTLNFDREKEENIKQHIHNHCPSCRFLRKLK